ncbi:pyridoxamine 5'-phosphate oxidase family protein [Halostella sp. JP-L12]|uniref:pyridoxamine 5'-phosphate oxidase family protein n=1 Tax=Halostella TaxID=1843185 RepID=UPI000EF789FC|nr:MULTISPECIES: pyridoxamine 5'-phosphate oxidase family protein [Halostella]NHN49195.1 pyridoxamine 5'-phosphate oxidase family protein [Halostella sp. JP-L12]
MSQDIGEALSAEEIDGFLRERGLGVLGFATGSEAYTIPIAFAYDGDSNRCFFRFIMGSDSLKRSFVSETDVASLTVYEWKTKNQWKSVVMRGPIREVENADLDVAATLFSAIGEEAALEVFNDSLSEYETVWYELEASEITGRCRYVGSGPSHD